MTHDLGQTRIELDLQIEVCVNVPKPGHQPAAGCINDLSRLAPVEVHTDFCDLTIDDGDVLMTGKLCASVKEERVFDEGIPGHDRGCTAVPASVPASAGVPRAGG